MPLFWRAAFPRLRASSRFPSRRMFDESCRLSAVKMRTLFRPREIVTYHCSELVAAGTEESAKST